MSAPPLNSDIRRADTGIYTSEGMLAGTRAAGLTKARNRQIENYEKSRKAIEESARSVSVATIDAKFARTTTTPEEDVKAKTVGLVTAEQFRRAREIAAKKEAEDKLKQEEKDRVVKERKVEEAKKKRKSATLSFNVDELEGEEDVGGSGVARASPKVAPKVTAAAAAAAAGGAGGPPDTSKRHKFGKDPTVETSFLPDQEREAAEAQMREKLKAEWLAEQERVKGELLTITYSYWDGSGHRRDITVAKGTSVGRFLELVRQEISSEFPELRSVSAENLLYIKEDLIIPHHHTFYELILTKARGKSGPLFHFDVHDDVRITQDTRVEKDESHPGKIVERHWYERNKHIFPASRWEVYDPTVKRDKYTIHGGEVR